MVLTRLLTIGETGQNLSEVSCDTPLSMPLLRITK